MHPATSTNDRTDLDQMFTSKAALPPGHLANGMHTINHAVKRARHWEMGLRASAWSRPPAATAIKANPPTMVSMCKLCRPGILSKMPLKIAARKNTTKGKTLRTTGFVDRRPGGTNSLHELMQDVP